MSVHSTGRDRGLADTLYRVPRQNGVFALQASGVSAARELSSWRVKLGPQESTAFETLRNEAVLVLQQGEGRLKVSDETWEVSRKNVVDEPATALYLPPDTSVTVDAHGPLEAIIVAAPAEDCGTAALVSANQVKIQQRGEGNYSREVHDILVNDHFAQRLLVGETFNPPGNWSSYPPHKHDGRDGEPKLEEVYHYRIDPDQGFGYQTLYTADGESVTHMVRDGDTVVIPYGYHPVASPPGYRLYYLWALVGEKRELTVFEDPLHSWITRS